jgi:lysophospholipase L1-like esterase
VRAQRQERPNVNVRVAAFGVLLLLTTAAPLRAELMPHAVTEHDQVEARRWFAQHTAMVERAKRGGIRLLFIGDSLTYAWLLDGRETWDARFVPLGAENFGIGGDRTVDVQWRAANGELDGIAPRAVVLSIGTNDLGVGRSVAATADGIDACVRAIRAKLPNAIVIVAGVLPRGTGGAQTPLRRHITAVNARVAKLADGRMVRFVDAGGAFLKPNGEVRAELYRFDFIHLSGEGYRVWAKALSPVLARIRLR